MNTNYVHFRCLLLSIILTLPSVVLSQPAESYPGWERVVVSEKSLLENRRDQIADIGWGGFRRFAAAYIVSPDQFAVGSSGDSTTGTNATASPGVPEPFEEFGDLYVSNFDVDKGIKSTPVKVEGIGSAAWVRAATGGPIVTRTCPPIFHQAAASITPQSPSLNPEYSTYFAYDARRSGDVDSSVNLYHVKWCNGVKYDSYFVDFGYRPSVAIGERIGEKKLLLVYGTASGIRGQYVSINGERMGPSIEIANFGDAVVSTDVIWNPVGDHFIVGYMQFVGGVSAVPENCAIKNVRVSWDGSVDEPIIHGACDPERRGHHTSVDIDLRRSINRNGNYAWWYEGHDGKGVHVMDSSGNPIAKLTKPLQTGWTLPVTARHEQDNRGHIRRFFTNIFGDPIDSYSMVGRASLQSTADKRISAWSFTNDGTISPIGLITSTTRSADPIAIEALQSDTVVLWHCCFSSSAPGYGEWGLSVFKNRNQVPGLVLDQ